jgi:4-hydroxy-tetrahydrodipicolinate reductase
MDKAPQNRKLRVVQWAPGDTGGRAMKMIIQHPKMKLVGLFAYSENKLGRDAGELCGLAPLGVKATNDINEIIATGADCVVYTPRGPMNVEEICRLLESGMNIVTTRVDFHNPKKLDPDVYQSIEDACRRGKSSIHSTGSSPGFSTEALPLALLYLQRRLDCLSIDEYADISGRDSPRLHFDVLGFGKSPAEYHEGKFADGLNIGKVGSYYYNAFSLIADAISLPMDDFEAKSEIAMTRHRLPIACGIIEAGTVAALRVSVTGKRRGVPLFKMRMHWYCTKDIDADWELRGDGWRVQVEGDAPLDINITLPISKKVFYEVSPGYTAHPAVNAIPAVCAARPGFVTFLDLPHIVPNFETGTP